MNRQGERGARSEDVSHCVPVPGLGDGRQEVSLVCLCRRPGRCGRPGGTISSLVDSPFRAWTFSSNLEALAYGRGSYELMSCNPVDGCLISAVTFSALHATLFYVGVPLALAAVAAAWFRRRDVI
jgi:hypothetical protein